MNKVFIDTNIFIYFLSENNSKEKQSCEQLFDQIEVGKIRPYTSSIVFMELVYVLVKTFKQSKKKAHYILDKFLQMRNLTFIEKTDTKKALSYFEQHNIKFGNCLIATQVGSEVILLTYDKDFKRFTELKTKTPAEFLFK